ncbi:MAG: 2Fe-2S iron-sulfur cluster-binding protein, partial [Alphaproteobacteria bacterium]|nr:2Fe-2S iron-sulfur cluster-binding protein [Alphaproteobacteria bacterium]
MTDFSLDGRTVTAEAGESIWQAARRAGIAIPHLCATPQPGYRADGNCRVCMVEIEGERDLVASCMREPSDGMVVNSAGHRATKAREMVMELLLTDQPSDGDSELRRWAKTMGVTESRFPAREATESDTSHPAMAVNLDACIQCTRCVRACREIQVNDV